MKLHHITTKIIIFLIVFSLHGSSYAKAQLSLVQPTPLATEVSSLMAARGQISSLSKFAKFGGWVGLVASIAIPAGLDWYFNDDGTVSVPMSAPTVNTTPLTPSNYSYMSSQGKDCYSGAPEDCLLWYNNTIMPILYPPASWGVVVREFTSPPSSIEWLNNGSNGQYKAHYIKYQTGTIVHQYQNKTSNLAPAIYECPNGSVYTSTIGCNAVRQTGAVTPQRETKSLSDAVNALPDSKKNEVITAQNLADALNLFLQKEALQPNANPDTQSPVTAAQVQAMRDLTSQVGRIADLAQPYQTPNDLTDPTKENVTSTPEKFDFTITETTNTIPSQIFTANYTPTIFSASTGCPSPIQFTIFDKPYSISHEYLCQLMSTLSPIFITIGSLSAAIIFARGFKT